MNNRPLIRRVDQLEIRELPDNEVFVYDRQQRITHHLPSETALVWERCDGLNEPSDLERIVRTELDIVEAKVAVRAAIKRLFQLNLLRQ